MGSGAGAGSGEFHTYRHSRRREQERLKRIEEDAEREERERERQVRPVDSLLNFARLHAYQNSIQTFILTLSLCLLVQEKSKELEESDEARTAKRRAKRQKKKVSVLSFLKARAVGGVSPDNQPYLKFLSHCAGETAEQAGTC